MENKQQNLFSSGKGKLLIGVAGVAVILIGYFLYQGSTPPEEYFSGTSRGDIRGVEKAKKYQAEQLVDKDILLQNPELQDLLQNEKVQELLNDANFRKLMADTRYAVAWSNMLADDKTRELMADTRYAVAWSNVLANQDYAKLMADTRYAVAWSNLLQSDGFHKMMAEEGSELTAK